MVQAQTLVNKINEEHTKAGTITADFVSSTRDNNGHVYVAGNTFTVASQKDDAIVRKYEIGTGKLLWEFIYNDITDMVDFATDVYANDNYVYVTGTSMDINTSESYIFSLVLDQTSGTQISLLKYQPSFGAYAIAASVKADGAGNVYVCGTEQNAATDFQIFVLAYDSTFSPMWQTYYDSTTNLDGAVSMHLNKKGDLNIIGYSGTTFSNWDFVTLRVQATDGILLGSSFSPNGNGNISRPVDFTTDFNGDLYVLGETALSPTNTDWKLIKYDTLFNEVWVRTFGSADSLQDKPVSIAADYAGQLLVTGFTSKSDGSTDATTYRIHKNGNTIWQRSLSAATPGENAKAADMVLAPAPATDFYINGSSHHQGDEDFFTAKYDIDGNLKWLKYFNDTTASQDHCRDLQIDGSGVLYSSGTVTTATDTGFVTVVYKEWEGDSSLVYDTSGSPIFVDKQLIVRFNPALLNPIFINDKDLQYSDIKGVLIDSIIDRLSTKVGFPLSRAGISKVFGQLSMADSLSITRDGDTIVSPKFWATMILHLPGDAINPLLAVQDSLNTIPDIIYNAGKNLIVHNFSYPDDPYYPTSSGNYASSYNSLCDPVQGINICPLWDDGRFGDYGIRIGIFDSGVRFTHEEFVTAPLQSKAFEGHDFNTGQNNPSTDLENHGTGVAGIAAGLTNNALGGSGVAGGDITGFGSNPGCAIINMKAGSTLAKRCEALVMGATNSPDGTIGYEVHVANMSWGFNSVGAQPSDIQNIKDAIRWLYRNSVVCIAACGDNNLQTENLPASLPQGNIVINVAGSNELGTGSSSFSSNPSVDFIAPSLAHQFVIPSSLGDDSYFNLTSTGAFQGTSFSAPLVAGVAGVLMSYYYDATYTGGSGVLLYPDDVENLLEIYAKNNLPGSTFGHGLIDAGNAYNHIKYPAYKIRHRVTASVNSSTVQKISSNATIKFNENYEQASSTFGSPNILLTAGTYTADIYKVGGATVPFNLLPGETIINYWKNNSKTTLFREPQGAQNIVVPEFDFNIISVTNANGVFEGYTYHITSGPNGSMNQWVPVDVSGNNFGNGKVNYTLHTYNSTIDGISETSGTEDMLYVYPNPASTLLYVDIRDRNIENCMLAIYDLSGKKIWESDYAFIDGEKKYAIKMTSFEPGTYLLVVVNENFKAYEKIVVWH